MDNLLDRFVGEIMAEYKEATPEFHTSSVQALSLYYDQYKAHRLTLIRAVNNTPELFFENPDVGGMLVELIQSVDVLVPRAIDSYYDLSNKHDIRHLKPKEVCDIHPDPIGFYSELKMWLNLKFGANGYKALKDMEVTEEKLRKLNRDRGNG